MSNISNKYQEEIREHLHALELKAFSMLQGVKNLREAWDLYLNIEQDFKVVCPCCGLSPSITPLLDEVFNDIDQEGFPRGADVELSKVLIVYEWNFDGPQEELDELQWEIINSGYTHFTYDW